MTETRDPYELARQATITRAFRGFSTVYVRFLPWWRCLWNVPCAKCGKPSFRRLADEHRRRFCVECWGDQADGEDMPIYAPPPPRPWSEVREEVLKRAHQEPKP